VTAVFCDVVGSTSLGESTDPEAVRALLARYFERMRSIVEHHGGTVQKFIGDAVVAVFGVPALHEDDALRALRAAAEMRDALPELGVEARIGVNSGEVVTSADDTLVTGDAINVAARLQQAAAPGEVLIGAETRLLAGTAAQVEELGPLELKGKAAPVTAFRLVSAGRAQERPHTSRFVGREPELALLRGAWERATREGRCELVTVLGEPGVGKSRLVEEFREGLGAQAVRGRCLSYGEGITYFPVVEVIRQLDSTPPDAAVGAAIKSLLGESGIATSPDDIAWAFRKLLEHAAPVIVVFDDIQWGEDTFLDLVEQVALLSAGAPMLVVCLARPELAERRPGWPVSARLEPLGPGDVDALLPGTVTGKLRERIAHAAGGNPLYLTEMVAMAADGGDVSVPGTLKALLAARLDRLDRAERGVLERGAVEGELFHRGAVQALEPTDLNVAPRLTALVRKELIRPERPLLPSEDGFRFCHLLVRDTAYEAVPKARRVVLHERLAAWLVESSVDLVERDEIVGYHLQQAYCYRVDLGDAEELARSVAERAARHLVAAGGRAAKRGDVHAAVNLFERALALGVPDARERARIQVDLGDVLYEAGRISDSVELLLTTRATADELGERRLVAMALIHICKARAGEPDRDLDEAESQEREAVAILGELGDERGLALARRDLALLLFRSSREVEGDDEMDRALAHAEASGDPVVRRRVIGTLVNRLAHGPTPAAEIAERCETLLAATSGDRILDATLKRMLGIAYAMEGRVGEARELIEESGRVLDEADQLTVTAMYRNHAAHARELVGDRVGAERELIARWAYFGGSESGLSDRRAVDSAYRLALLYCGDGRWDDAGRIAALLRDVPLGSVHSREQVVQRYAVDGLLAAHEGRLAEAVELAEHGVELVRSWGRERPNLAAAALVALSEVRRAAGDETGAAAASAEAIEYYELKGNVAGIAALGSRF
jgi:class 3 adenylate cyclase/tetratricopeptide (TPR) repeat protein